MTEELRRVVLRRNVQGSLVKVTVRPLRVALMAQ